MKEEFEEGNTVSEAYVKSMVMDGAHKYIICLSKNGRRIIHYTIKTKETRTFVLKKNALAVNFYFDKIYVFFEDGICGIYAKVRSSKGLLNIELTRTIVAHDQIFNFPISDISEYDTEYVYFTNDQYYYGNSYFKMTPSAYETYYVQDDYLFVVEKFKILVFEKYRGLVYTDNDPNTQFLSIRNRKVYRLYGNLDEKGPRIKGHDLNLYLKDIGATYAYSVSQFYSIENKIILYNKDDGTLRLYNKSLGKYILLIDAQEFIYHNETLYYIEKDKLHIHPIENPFHLPFKTIDKSCEYKEMEDEFDVSDNEYVDF